MPLRALKKNKNKNHATFKMPRLNKISHSMSSSSSSHIFSLLLCLCTWLTTKPDHSIYESYPVSWLQTQTAPSDTTNSMIHGLPSHKLFHKPFVFTLKQNTHVGLTFCSSLQSSRVMVLYTYISKFLILAVFIVTFPVWF
jgi:hypothetical protein